MKHLPALIFSFSAVLAVSCFAQDTANTPTEASVSIEEWNGSVDEHGFIPELGHTASYEEGFINLRVWNNKVRLYFMDEEKKVIDPPASLVTARLAIRGDRDQFLRLTPQGQFLSNVYFVRTPYIFRVNMKIHDEKEEGTAMGFMFTQDKIK